MVTLTKAPPSRARRRTRRRGTIFVQSAAMPAPVDAPFDRRPRPWSRRKADPAGVARRRALQPHPADGGQRRPGRTRNSDRREIPRPVDGLPRHDRRSPLRPQRRDRDGRGHFDSWHSGTGATDNGAGSAVAMVCASFIARRQTAPDGSHRVVGGEEAGADRLARTSISITPRRQASGSSAGSRGQQGQGQQGHNGEQQGQQTPIALKPAHEKFSAYFNLDKWDGQDSRRLSAGQRGRAPDLPRLARAVPRPGGGDADQREHQRHRSPLIRRGWIARLVHPG